MTRLCGLNRWRICQSAKFALVSNEEVPLHDYHVLCSIHTSEHSVIFGQIRFSEKLNKCHFMSFHDYHVVSSIHTSEHSVNIRTNSAFRKIPPSDNFCFRTYAIPNCLNQIRIFYNFLVKTCFHHNICHHQIQKKFFKIPFLAINRL